MTTLPKSSKCMSCREVVPLHYHCIQCLKDLCNHCANTHRRKNKTHSVLLMTNEAGSETQESAVRDKSCRHGSSESQKYYCCNCDEKLCRMCRKFHKIPLQEGDHFVVTVVDCIRDQAKNFPADEVLVDQPLLTRYRTAFRRIKEWGNTSHEMVNEKERVLLDQVQTFKDQRTSYLKQALATYQAAKETYSRSLQVLNRATESGDLTEIRKATELCELELSKVRLLGEPVPLKELVLVKPGKDTFTAIQQMGTVDLKDCFIYADYPANTSQPLREPQVPPTITSGPQTVQASGPFNCALPRQSPSVQRLCDYSSIGVPTVVIGSEGSEDGQFCRPWGVCCSKDGLLFVADRANHRIQIFSLDGGFVGKFGQYGTVPGSFNRPTGVACDPQGRIFVTDKDNHRVQVFTQQGQLLFTFGQFGQRNGDFHYPWDIDVSHSGYFVVVSDSRNFRIQLFTHDGSFLKKFGRENVCFQPAYFHTPRGVCFNREGRVYVTDFENHHLIVIELDFTRAKYVGKAGSERQTFMRPQGVAVDQKGNILIADSRNHRIQVLEESGAYKWQFGSENQPFGYPCGVTLTPTGRVVVVDYGNHRVLIF